MIVGQILRFGAIGLLATLIHVAVFNLFATGLGWNPSIANVYGFLAALGFSFLGQSRWTFPEANATASDRRRRFRRFVASALLGFLLNALIVHLVTQAAHLPPVYATPFMVVFVPAVLFVVNRLWVFSASGQASSSGDAPSRRFRDYAVHPAFLLLLLCLLLMLPALAFSDMRWGHDAKYHLPWQNVFSQELFSQILYPRWLPQRNDGFGSPTFFIYPPLAHTVTSLLRPFLPNEDGIAVRIAVSSTLALYSGGFGVIGWLRSRTDRSWVLFAASAAYVATPYHMFVDTYQRVAFAELWAFAAVPFVLWGIDLVRTRHASGYAIMVASFTALILSHAPSIIIYIPFIGLYGLIQPAYQRSLAQALLCTAALATAMMISAPYLFVALSHTAFINADALYTDYFNGSRWLLGKGDWPSIGVQKTIYLVAALQFVIGGLLFVLSLSRNKATRSNGDLLFSLLVMLATAFLVSTPSAFLWDLKTPLSRVQFPWRFLSLHSIVLALLVCTASGTQFSRLLHPRLLRSATIFATLGLLIASNIALYANWRLTRGSDSAATLALAIKKEAPEYVLGDMAQLRELLPDGELARIASGRADVAVDTWENRHVRLRVDAQSEATVVVRQFFYSGWWARMDGGSAVPARAFSKDEPVVAFDVAAGRHDLELRLVETPSEYWGWRVSLAGTVLSALLLLLLSRSKRKADRQAKILA